MFYELWWSYHVSPFIGSQIFPVALWSWWVDHKQGQGTEELRWTAWKAKKTLWKSLDSKRDQTSQPMKSTRILLKTTWKPNILATYIRENTWKDPRWERLKAMRKGWSWWDCWITSLTQRHTKWTWEIVKDREVWVSDGQRVDTTWRTEQQ